jgi:hypothetical protein
MVRRVKSATPFTLGPIARYFLGASPLPIDHEL